MSWGYNDKESFYNAQAAAEVPYFDDPECLHKLGMLDAGEHVEVVECGGKCNMYLRVEGKGWVPCGHLIFHSEDVERRFKPWRKDDKR